MNAEPRGGLALTAFTSGTTRRAPHGLHTHKAPKAARTVQAETDDGPIDLTLEYVKTLGHGRGARVDLVRDLRTNRLIAEKVFGFGRGLSSLITNTLYRLCFQTPFPYRTTASAVWAAFYRRKAVRLLTEYWFGAPHVADALYVRWDAEARAFVLGTEYIAGRGPRVSPPDPHTFQRWLRARSLPPRPVAEMDGLVAFMLRLRSHLRESGFIGTQWQVDRRTLVATANFLYHGGRWIAVDLESGIPAVTIPGYLWQGLRLRRFPLFDDTDFPTLWSYVDWHADALAHRLGTASMYRLRHAIKELEVQEERWKAGEVALLREPRRWIDPDARAHIRHQTLERWVQEGRIGHESAGVLAASTPRFLAQVAFGGIVGRASRWIRFLCEREYRATVVSPYVGAWVEAGRLPGDTGMRLVCNPRLLSLAALACTAMLPIALVHFFRDPRCRRAALKRAYRAVVDERYQLHLAEQYITRRIKEWESAHRLTSQESEVLRHTVATPSAQEYVRGFGVHLGLKALLPSALLDPLLVGAALTTDSMYPLALLFIRSLAITAYTVMRWIKRPKLQFRTAFAVGLVPKLGILAYPSQLFAVHPELASFLVRDLASRLGERLPIYGGRHTLTEHYCIRGADLLLSLGHSLAHFSPANLWACIRRLGPPLIAGD